MYVMDYISVAVLSWALGGIPFGVLLARAFRLPDPRTIGSGNIGATNMLRTGRKDVAILTLLLDAGKGVAAVLISAYLYPADEDILAIAVLFAAIGHMYTPWLRFKGGKGVATILGATIAFSWPVGMAGAIFWLLTFYTLRYVSLASIVALSLMPFVAWLRVDGDCALLLAIASAIAIWRHRENINRLRQGFEPRFNFGRKK